MYTKFCYLFMAFMLTVSTSASAPKNQKIENRAEQMTTAMSKEHGAAEESSVPFPVEAPIKHSKTATAPKHHPDEDGKHHDFHFNRLQALRRRQICCFFAKVILALMHISWLIYGYMHLTH